MPENLEQKIEHTEPGCIDLLGSFLIPGYSLMYVIANRNGARYNLRGCIETELAKIMVYGMGTLIICNKYLLPGT